jgi:ubiquinone/menaquinone biosynthesis C-methylase UbiE
VNRVKEENVRKMVREGYAKKAKAEKQGCGCGCGGSISEQIGYSCQELTSVPEGADLSLGCGNPVALASLNEGETVVDLGSGGGLDCFLAAKKVGAKGKVIGVDMTSDMLDRARANCRKGAYKNVEFRLGEIENLPVADSVADVVISNCVINLSPAKQRVFDEAFRVLKPGGRLMISDMVLLKELPESVKRNVLAYVGCISGAEMKTAYLKMIENAGFREVKVIEETSFPLELMLDDPGAEAVMKELNLTRKRAAELVNSIASIKVSAAKP